VYTDMEWFTKVRLEVLRKKRKKREIPRSEGIGCETLKKIFVHPEPPGYRLKGPQIVEEDKARPRKQRHTAKRICEHIREMVHGASTPR